MEAGLLAEFAKFGLFGLLFFVLLLALRSRDASYREVQEKRIQEHKDNTERFLLATNANTEVTRAAADGFKVLAKSVDEMKAQLPARRGGRR